MFVASCKIFLNYITPLNVLLGNILQKKLQDVFKNKLKLM